MDDLQKMASELAAECIAVQKGISDDRFFIQVTSVLDASSQTLEEAFLTNVRTKMAFDIPLIAANGMAICPFRTCAVLCALFYRLGLGRSITRST